MFLLWTCFKTSPVVVSDPIGRENSEEPDGLPLSEPFVVLPEAPILVTPSSSISVSFPVLCPERRRCLLSYSWHYRFRSVPFLQSSTLGVRRVLSDTFVYLLTRCFIYSLFLFLRIPLYLLLFHCLFFLFFYRVDYYFPLKENDKKVLSRVHGSTYRRLMETSERKGK